MSRMPSTSTGTRNVRCVGRGSTPPRRAAGCRPAAGSTRARRARRAAPARPCRVRARRAAGRRVPRRAGARRGAACRATGSVTTACASSRSATSSASRSDAPSVRRSDTPGATRAISATTGGTSQGLTVPTTPSVACPVCSPCSIERSLPQRVELAADGPGPLEHPHTELGRDRAPPVPHEQLHAELGFELADLLRDVRLHRVEAVGRGR